MAPVAAPQPSFSKALLQGKPGALLRLSLEAQREDDYRGEPTNKSWLLEQCEVWRRGFLLLDEELSELRRKGGEDRRATV